MQKTVIRHIHHALCHHGLVTIPTAGDTMAMNESNLWAPWRMSYIKQLAAADQSAPKPDAGCFLCNAGNVTIPSEEASSQFVLHKDAHGLLMLNRYPYTNGHLMVAPIVHAGELSDLSADVRAGLMELTELGTRLLKAAINPQGVNIGINMGRCAGAGVPGHLHIHLVPRWQGDTNFMHTVGRVQVIPQALEESHGYLSEMLGKIQK